MKNIVLTLVAFLCSNFLFSQNSLGKSDDLGRIVISSYIPEQVEGISDITMQFLTNKLDQIITNAGLSGGDSRFIITPSISVLNKEVTSTAPTMIALTLNISFYIGDGIDGTKFSSYTTTVKGVGLNETKAYISAIKNVKINDPGYVSFINKGKTKIIEYYNSKCDFLIKQAQSIASSDRYDEAIYRLVQVPDVCKDCYNKAMDAVSPIYKAKIDKECKLLLTKANILWAASQDLNAASSISDILNQLDPNSSCYPEVQKLVAEVSKRVNDLEQREWNFKLKEQQDNIDLRKASIQASRDIGVAYGNNQPKNTYNFSTIRTWW